MKLHNQLKNLQRSMYFALTATVLVAVFLIWLLNRSTLAISVEPDNAVVTVDNRPLQQNTAGDIKTILAPGNYTLKVEADGFVAKIETVALRRARSLKLDITLDPAPKPYTITGETDIAENVQFISEADDFNTIFYLANGSSTLYKAKFNINDTNEIENVYNRQVSNPPLKGITNIVWSPKKDAAILQKGKNAVFFDFQKYNFVSQEEVPFGNDIGDIAWSPDDSKIAYYYAPINGEKSLIFANKTNSEMTRVANLADLQIDNPYLSWSPDSEWLIVIPRNSNFSTNKIYLFNAYTRSFKEISDTGNNLEAKFSGDGSKIIYTTYSIETNSPVRATVSVMDQDGANKRTVNLRADLGKISWLNNSNSEIIVATWDKDKSAEAIFAYDIANKKQSSFNYLLPPNIYLRELSISKNNNLLFYIANQQFYVIKLKT